MSDALDFDLDLKLRPIAKKITEEIWEHLSPAIREAIEMKMVKIAAENWQFSGPMNDTISRAIEDATKRHIEITYAPVLDEIAKRKARKHVAMRAAQNKIPEAELPFPNGDKG